MKKNTSALIYAGIAVLLWSTVATAFKIAQRDIGSFSLLFSAAQWSALALLLTVLLKKKGKALFQLKKKEYVRTLLLSLLNPVAYYLVLFYAYERLPAQIAQPLNYTWPIMLVLLSIPFLKQPARWKDILSFGLCFIGILLISSGGNSLRPVRFSTSGIALALCSALLWALYWVLNNRISGDSEVRLFWTFAFSLPVLFLIKQLIPFESPEWTLPAVLSTAYVGLFEMGITFIFWSMAMKNADRAADIGNLIYLSPFLSLIWIRFILGETIYLTTITGLVTIVAGILAGQIKQRQKAL
jgi:drug/metabolite transporter (DMT)-like permease